MTETQNPGPIGSVRVSAARSCSASNRSTSFSATYTSVSAAGAGALRLAERNVLGFAAATLGLAPNGHPRPVPHSFNRVIAGHAENMSLRV
jgi:hypothetical protein